MKVNEGRDGYKKTKLGWIPEEWDTRKLDLIAFIKQGVSKGRSLKNKNVISVPYLRVANVKDGFFDLTEIKLIDIGDEELEKFKLSKGDIIITEGGDPDKLGRGNLWQGQIANCVFQNHLFRIRCDNERLWNFYLNHFLQGRAAKNYFVSCAKQTTGIASVNSTQVKATPIPLPPLPEQKKIAEILSTWDRAISTTQQLISTLKERNKGLAQQLLTGRKRLPGFEREWVEFQYNDLIKEVRRKFEWDDGELYDLISVKRRSGGVFFRESLYGHQIKTKNLRTAKEGDFLISKMQIVHGASALTSSEFDQMKISGSYLAVIPKEENRLDIRFFSWLAKTPYFYHQTYISSYGVHIEKMTFNFKSFLKLGTLIPATLGEQQAIVSVLETGEEEVKYLKKKLLVLQNQKKGLMQQLLTGQKRVKQNEKDD